jgi:hypothetical protein
VEKERDADGPGFVDKQHCRPLLLQVVAMKKGLVSRNGR